MPHLHSWMHGVPCYSRHSYLNLNRVIQRFASVFMWSSTQADPSLEHFSLHYTYDLLLSETVTDVAAARCAIQEDDITAVSNGLRGDLVR